MQFDRYDIIEAWYWICVNWHGGQGSKLYARLSKISSYYKPGATQREPMTENGKDIYRAIEERMERDNA